MVPCRVGKVAAAAKTAVEGHWEATLAAALLEVEARVEGAAVCPEDTEVVTAAKVATAVAKAWAGRAVARA